MAQLFVLSGPDVGKSFEVQPGDRVGRAAECAITLRHPSISREHAHFERDGERWFIVDDGSRNGVSIDKARVQRAELQDQQEFHLGELLLRFRSGAAVGAYVTNITPRAPSAAAPRVEEPDEISLEGDNEPTLDEPPARADYEPRIAPELIPTHISPRVPPPAPKPLVSSLRDTGFGRAPAGAAAGDAIARSKRAAGERVLQYQKFEQREGVASADLAQLAGTTKFVLALLAVLVMALAAALSFKGTSWVKRLFAGSERVEVEGSKQ